MRIRLMLVLLAILLILSLVFLPPKLVTGSSFQNSFDSISYKDHYSVSFQRFQNLPHLLLHCLCLLLLFVSLNNHSFRYFVLFALAHPILLVSQLFSVSSRMMLSLRSIAITATSSLLRITPPLQNTFLLSTLSFCNLYLFDFHHSTGSHVSHRSLIHAHATLMPFYR